MNIGEWYIVKYILGGQNLSIYAPLYKERETTYIFNISQQPNGLAPFSVRKDTITRVFTKDEYESFVKTLNSN